VRIVRMLTASAPPTTLAARLMESPSQARRMPVAQFAAPAGPCAIGGPLSAWLGAYPVPCAARSPGDARRGVPSGSRGAGTASARGASCSGHPPRTRKCRCGAAHLVAHRRCLVGEHPARNCRCDDTRGQCDAQQADNRKLLLNLIVSPVASRYLARTYQNAPAAHGVQLQGRWDRGTLRSTRRHEGLTREIRPRVLPPLLLDQTAVANRREMGRVPASSPP
jgi:hypothetical protein